MTSLRTLKQRQGNTLKFHVIFLDNQPLIKCSKVFDWNVRILKKTFGSGAFAQFHL